jgi:hypothetical protein
MEPALFFYTKSLAPVFVRQQNAPASRLSDLSAAFSGKMMQMVQNLVNLSFPFAQLPRSTFLTSPSEQVSHSSYHTQTGPRLFVHLEPGSQGC